MTYVVLGILALVVIALCVVGNRRRRGGAGTLHADRGTAGHAEAQTHAGVRGTNNTGSPHAH